MGLLSLALAMGIGRFAYTPLLPLMIRDGLLGGDTGAWLATANYAGYLLGALYASSIRLPPARQMNLSWIAIVAVTACMAVGNSAALWILWRFIAGVLSACALIATSAWVLPQLAQLGRPALAGVVYAGIGVGIAGVGVFCLIAARIGSDARSMWIGLALLAGIVAVSARRLMLQPDIPEARRDPEDPSIPPRKTGLLIFCYGVGGFGYILPATFLPIMARALVDDPAKFGLAWPIFGVAATLSTLIIAYGLPRANRMKVWSLSYIAMAIGAALPTVWPSLIAVIVSALLVGGTFLIITMAGFQEARARAPSAPTALLGRMTAAFAFGQILGPALVPIIPGQTAGSALPLCLRFAAACLLGAAALLWTMAPANSDDSPHAASRSRGAG